MMNSELISMGISPCRIARTHLGKPFIKNSPYHISLTHCGGFCACCVSEAPVGIDAEPIRDFNPQAAKKALTNSEHKLVAKHGREMFFKLWTLKESYLKALGEGLGFGLKNAEFFVNESGIITSHPENAVFHQQLIGGYIVSSAEING